MAKITVHYLHPDGFTWDESEVLHTCKKTVRTHERAKAWHIAQNESTGKGWSVLAREDSDGNPSGLIIDDVGIIRVLATLTTPEPREVFITEPPNAIFAGGMRHLCGKASSAEEARTVAEKAADEYGHPHPAGQCTLEGGEWLLPAAAV